MAVQQHNDNASTTSCNSNTSLVQKIKNHKQSKRAKAKKELRSFMNSGSDFDYLATAQVLLRERGAGQRRRRRREPQRRLLRTCLALKNDVGDLYLVFLKPPSEGSKLMGVLALRGGADNSNQRNVEVQEMGSNRFRLVWQPTAEDSESSSSSSSSSCSSISSVSQHIWRTVSSSLSSLTTASAASTASTVDESNSNHDNDDDAASITSAASESSYSSSKSATTTTSSSASNTCWELEIVDLGGDTGADLNRLLSTLAE